MLRVGLLFALTAVVARAEPAASTLVLVDAHLSPAAAASISHQASRRGLEVAAPAPAPEAASESVLAEVRPLYQDMAFGQAAKKLARAEGPLIAGRLPSPGLVRALADLQLWMGACLFLAKDRAQASDRWTLALRLSPTARPDRLFPPEVRAAFPRSASGRAVRVKVQLAPAGARLWVDGKRIEGALAVAPGLHYVVVERADRIPVAQVVRIIHTAPQIAVSLDEPAQPAEALRQAAARLKSAPLSREEGLGVSASIGRPLLVVTQHGDRLAATRFDARDPARPLVALDAPDGDSLVGSLCATDPTCRPLPAPPPPQPLALAPAPPAPKPRPRPVWKRAWFWGVIGASVAAAAGIAAGAAVGATSPRDYDIRVR